MSLPRWAGGRIGRTVLLSAVALGLSGCGKVAATGPRLQASWIGSDTGRIRAPAKAIWCPVAQRLEVTAVKGDVGFGLVVHPAGELEQAEYPVADPGIDSLTRPSASGAVRWFTEQQVRGFQSDSGSIALTRKGSQLEVRFLLRMRSLDGLDTIEASGKATRLVPGPCPADSVPNSSPKQ